MIFKRMIAYVVDITFIVLIVSMLSEIRFLNPHYEENYDANNRYFELYEEAIEENNLNFVKSDEYKNISYEISKTGVSISIMEIVCYIAYFVGFQYWNKGQTLGKKIVKIKVVNKDEEKKLNWLNLLLRTIILFNIYASVILVILILTISEKTYLNAYSIINTISVVVFYSSVLMIILRKDNRGIHELISKTKVVKE